MARHVRLAILALTSWMLLAASPSAGEAQGRGARPHPAHPPRPPAVRGQVFIGGYAEVLIDGQPWATTEEGHFVVQLPAGRHRVDIRRQGYRPFATDVDLRPRQTRPLNVTLRGTS